MKASRYNLFIQDKAHVYAVNLLSRAGLSLSRDAYEVLQNWTSGGVPDIAHPNEAAFARALTENLFLLDDDFDELAYIRERSREERFGSRQLGLVIAPTMGCNFACHYCFETHTEDRLSEDARNNLLRLVEAHLPDYEELSVQWFGGEPLTVLPMIETLSTDFLSLCQSYGAAYAATVITNGYHLTRNVSRRLSELGVRAVQVTLDGDKPLHDRTRYAPGRAGSFERILDNLRYVPGSIAVTVRVHVAPFNFESVLALIRRLADEGMAEHIETLYFAPLFNHKAGEHHAYRADGKRFASSAQFARMQVPLLEAAAARGFRLKDPLEVSYGICTAVRSNTLVVDAHGSLMKCYKDVGLADEAIGDLLTGPLPTATHEKWLEVEVPRDDECRECSFLPVCLGGCTKQWQEGADKSVICTPLKFNHEELFRHYFRQR